MKLKLAALILFAVFLIAPLAAAAGAPSQTLTVVSAHSGTTGGGAYTTGSTATFSVSDTVDTEGFLRYVFVGWSCTGSGCYSGGAPSASVVMNDNITETAEWILQYYFSASAYPSGTGTISGLTSGWFAPGSTVNVAANPGKNEVLNCWLISSAPALPSSCYQSGSAVSVGISGPTFLTANFINITLNEPTTNPMYDSNGNIRQNLDGTYYPGDAFWLYTPYTVTGNLTDVEANFLPVMRPVLPGVILTPKTNPLELNVTLDMCSGAGLSAYPYCASTNPVYMHFYNYTQEFEMNFNNTLGDSIFKGYTPGYNFTVVPYNPGVEAYSYFDIQSTLTSSSFPAISTGAGSFVPWNQTDANHADDILFVYLGNNLSKGYQPLERTILDHYQYRAFATTSLAMPYNAVDGNHTFIGDTAYQYEPTSLYLTRIWEYTAVQNSSAPGSPSILYSGAWSGGKSVVCEPGDQVLPRSYPTACVHYYSAYTGGDPVGNYNSYYFWYCFQGNVNATCTPTSVAPLNSTMYSCTTTVGSTLPCTPFTPPQYCAAFDVYNSNTGMCEHIYYDVKLPSEIDVNGCIDKMCHYFLFQFEPSIDSMSSILDANSSDYSLDPGMLKFASSDAINFTSSVPAVNITLGTDYTMQPSSSTFITDMVPYLSNIYTEPIMVSNYQCDGSTSVFTSYKEAAAHCGLVTTGTLYLGIQPCSVNRCSSAPTINDYFYSDFNYTDPALAADSTAGVIFNITGLYQPDPSYSQFVLCAPNTCSPLYQEYSSTTGVIDTGYTITSDPAGNGSLTPLNNTLFMISYRNGQINDNYDLLVYASPFFNGGSVYNPSINATGSAQTIYMNTGGEPLSGLVINKTTLSQNLLSLNINATQFTGGVTWIAFYNTNSSQLLVNETLPEGPSGVLMPGLIGETVVDVYIPTNVDKVTMVYGNWWGAKSAPVVLNVTTAANSSGGFTFPFSFDFISYFIFVVLGILVILRIVRRRGAEYDFDPMRI